MRAARCAVTLALVGWALGPGTPAPTFGAPPPASSSSPDTAGFGERIDVRAVNVEAVVTDRAGQRIRGLSRADFELRVDGKVVPIDSFAEVTEGHSAGPAGTQTPPAAGSGAVGTSYLVFVDDSFSITNPRNVVLDHLVNDLPLLGPEDRMAIVAFDGRRLQALSNWSGDLAALTAALRRAEERPTLGIHARDERRSFNAETALTAQALDDTMSPKGGGKVGNDTAATEVSDLKARGDSLTGTTGLVHRAVPGRCVEEFPISPLQCVELQEAIAAAAAALRGMPTPGGRKVALLLSGGWPYGAGQHLFKPLLDTADQLAYTLYPVDVAGIEPDTRRVDVALEKPADPTDLVSASWEREAKDSLEYLAAETGGKALLNSARLDALKRTVADTRTYYWLGFSPIWRANDAGHTIRVEVRRPGLTVRSRSGFVDLAPGTENAMRAESALLLSGSAADRRLKIELGALERHYGTFEVPITFAVPVSALTLTPRGAGYIATATLSLAVQDGTGGRASLPNIPLRLVLPRAPLPGSYARYRTRVKLRRTDQTLIALLRDPESGATLWDEKTIAQ